MEILPEFHSRATDTRSRPSLWNLDNKYLVAFIEAWGLGGYDHANPICSLNFSNPLRLSGVDSKAFDLLAEITKDRCDTSTKGERRTYENFLRKVLGEGVEIQVVSNERWDVLLGTSGGTSPIPYSIFKGENKKPKLLVKDSCFNLPNRELREAGLKILISHIASDLVDVGARARSNIFRHDPWKANLNEILKDWSTGASFPPISQVEPSKVETPSKKIWKQPGIPVKDLIRLCQIRIEQEGYDSHVSEAATIFYLADESRIDLPQSTARSLALACEKLRAQEFFIPIPSECVYPNRIGMNIRDKFRDDLALIAEEYEVDPAELLFLHITLLRSELRAYELTGEILPSLPSLEAIELRELAFLTLVDQSLTRKLHHEAFRSLKPSEYIETCMAVRDGLLMTQTEADIFLKVFLGELLGRLNNLDSDCTIEAKGNEKRYASCFRKILRDSDSGSPTRESIQSQEDLIRGMLIVNHDDSEILSLVMEHIRDSIPDLVKGTSCKTRIESEHGTIGAINLKLIVPHPTGTGDLTLEIQAMTQSFYDEKYNRGAAHKPIHEMDHQSPGQIGRQSSHSVYKHGKWSEAAIAVFHDIPRSSVPRQEYLVTEPLLLGNSRDERVREYLKKARRFTHVRTVNASDSLLKSNNLGEILKIRAGGNIADLYFAMAPVLDCSLEAFGVSKKGEKEILPLNYKLSPFETYIIHPATYIYHSKDEVKEALDETTSLIGLLKSAPESHLKFRETKNRAEARLKEYGLDGKEHQIAERLGIFKKGSKRIPNDFYLAVIATYPERENRQHLEGKPGELILGKQYLEALSLTIFSPITAQRMKDKIQVESDEPIGLDEILKILEFAKAKQLSLVDASELTEQDGVFFGSLQFRGQDLESKLRDLAEEARKISRPRSSTIYVGHTSAEVKFKLIDKPGELHKILSHLKNEKCFEESFLTFRGAKVVDDNIVLLLGYSSSYGLRERQDDLELRLRTLARELTNYLANEFKKDSEASIKILDTGKEIFVNTQLIEN